MVLMSLIVVVEMYIDDRNCGTCLYVMPLQEERQKLVRRGEELDWQSCLLTNQLEGGE